MMSSSQDFVPSSGLSAGDGALRKSKFTYRHLASLATYSTASPLRVIAHVDLDAFYAQCEMVRLGVDKEQPLGVQQWQGLIAINYPAKKRGCTRMISPPEAKKLCPEILLVHVATWKEGEDRWAYREDAASHIATQKVSLDPYRLQSRRILACIKETLPPPPLQRVEKGGIDEVFLDLSAQVHSILLERYPELQGPPPYDDPTENLPCPPSTVLDWDVDALVDLDPTEAEDDNPDWDDVAISIGSEIVRKVRRTIFEKLDYTTSGGIARNKIVAKLGSGHKKPNQQTVVRNRAVQEFLKGYKFTKFWNLGGKLGDQIAAAFGTELVSELLEVPFDRIKGRFSDDTASWIYQIIRGEDYGEVTSRTQIKSMLAHKSFRPSINSFEQGVRWLRIFSAEIFLRCVEEGVLENKRRPKTITLHHRQGGKVSSRQLPIPKGKAIDEPLILQLATDLFGQIIAEGRAFPCSNLSLSATGFEDGVADNKGIGGFLIKGEEAKALHALRIQESYSPFEDEDSHTEKRRKTDTGGIQKFFSRHDSNHDAGGEGVQNVEHPEADEKGEHAVEAEEQLFLSDHEDAPTKPAAKHQTSLDTFFCTRCQKAMPEATRAEHEDWHFAKDLQDSEQATSPPATATAGTAQTAQSHTNAGTSKTKPVKPQQRRGGGHAGGPSEKGQQKLHFGN